MNKFVMALSAAAVVAFAGNVASAADPANGEKIVKTRCHACHNYEKGKPKKVGPNLFGVIDRGPAKFEGFPYSKGFQEAASKFTWTDDNLHEYLADPTAFLRKVSGDAKVRSKMTFKLPKDSDRNDVIAFLHTLK